MLRLPFVASTIVPVTEMHSQRKQIRELTRHADERPCQRVRFWRLTLCSDVRARRYMGAGCMHGLFLRVTFAQSQRLQVLDNLHSFFFGQATTDHAVALWPVLELMPCVRIAL